MTPRPLPLEALTHTLDHPVAAHIVTDEGVTAGVVRRALEREGLNVHSTWSSLPDAAELAPHLDLIVIVETAAPHPDSDYAAIRAAAPDTTIVVICSPDRPGARCLIGGPIDGLVFEPGADALVGPVARSTLAGYIVVPRSLRTAVQAPALSGREREILALVVEGLTNHEIADRLYLAESTVKRHLSSIFKRLGVSSRREAAAAMLGSEVRVSAPPDPGHGSD